MNVDGTESPSHCVWLICYYRDNVLLRSRYTINKLSQTTFL